MDVDGIKNEYLKRKPSYECLEKEVEFILNREMKRYGISIQPLEKRVKKLDSLLDKIKRKSETGVTVESLDEIVDICGIRVICLFLSDIKRIGSLIEKTFRVESKDDKLLSKPKEEFGYFSVHYVCKLPRGIKGPRYDDIKELRFEIQVRTVAMHVWSTISGEIEYKSALSVPSHLKRDFYALSGLFYLADLHFELFFRSSRDSRESEEQKDYRTKAVMGEEINLDTVTTYLKQCYPERTHSDASVVSKLVEELVASGYRTIGELNNHLRCSKSAFEQYEKEHPLVDVGKFSDVGVVRVSLSIANKKYLESRMLSKSMLKRYSIFRKYLK